jgi:hypothetical protein
MFLHEFSRTISQGWRIKVDSEEYEELVRKWFENRCPYCSRELATGGSVIEHPDGMNRYRAGLHVPGNVLIACKACNSEKRRDDSLRVLTLAASGWESFLSHDGTRCSGTVCLTCRYWKVNWENEAQMQLDRNLQRIRAFRNQFPEFIQVNTRLAEVLPTLLMKLYGDCQSFAEAEIRSLLQNVAGKLDVRDQSRGSVE